MSNKNQFYLFIFLIIVIFYWNFTKHRSDVEQALFDENKITRCGKYLGIILIKKSPRAATLPYFKILLDQDTEATLFNSFKSSPSSKSLDALEGNINKKICVTYSPTYLINERFVPSNIEIVK